MDPTDPVGTVMAVAQPLFACMPLECPEPGAGGYDEMGMCTLMINIGLGSIAPMLPILEIMMDPVKLIGDLPGLNLGALPFLGLTIPPLPFPDPIGLQGSLEFPSWPGLDLPGIPALMDLLLGILTIPLNMCIGLLSFEVPDLSIDGILELLLPALAFKVDLPMLPTIGLFDLAICIIVLILLPFMLLAMVLAAAKPGDDGPLDEAFDAALGPLGAILALDPDKMMEEAQDKEAIKAKAEKILDKLIKEEEEAKAAEERRARAAAGDGDGDGDGDGGRGDSEWKPSIKDYYYG